MLPSLEGDLQLLLLPLLLRLHYPPPPLLFPILMWLLQSNPASIESIPPKTIVYHLHDNAAVVAPLKSLKCLTSPMILFLASCCVNLRRVIQLMKFPPSTMTHFLVLLFENLHRLKSPVVDPTSLNPIRKIPFLVLFFVNLHPIINHFLESILNNK